MESTASRLRPYGWALAALRVYTGLFWLDHGYLKLSSPMWSAPNGMCAQLLQTMAHDTSGPYHDFVTNVVLPHVTVFAVLVEWGETLTGLALVLGLFTRFAGIVGVFLPLNYWLAKSGYAHVDGYFGLDLGAAALSIVHAIIPTGRIAGIDGLIFARRRARMQPREDDAYNRRFPR